MDRFPSQRRSMGINFALENRLQPNGLNQVRKFPILSSSLPCSSPFKSFVANGRSSQPPSALLQQPLCAAPQLAQQVDQDSAFAESKRGYCLLHRLLMVRKRLADQSSAAVCQVHHTGAAVVGVVAALYPSTALESVDCGRNRSAGQKHFCPQRADRQRSFVQKCFEDPKIACAHSQQPDVL